MKRSLVLLGLVAALAGCGAPAASPAPSAAPPAPPAADSAALRPRPTVTSPPPTLTATAFPTETPAPPALPTETPAPPALPTETPAPTAQIRQAGVDPGGWVEYRNDQYGFSLRYPPCLGQIVEEPAYSRPAGLYTEGYSRETSYAITSTLNLSSGPVSPDCVAQHMSILVFDLAGYSHYNVYSELTYDPATGGWLRNNGDGPEPDDGELVAGEAWVGHPFGFGDAELISSGLAVPWEDRQIVVEIAFGYQFSQDGRHEPGLDAATIDQILQTLRFAP